MAGKNMLDGAQVIVDYLVREKVPYAFGLCGHGNIQFIDALYGRAEEIKTISVHHETVAGFMADVNYRVSGQPTATFTSCGPGSANLPIALGNAFLDSVPFLAVTGNIPTSQFNRGAFQELYRHYQADFPSTVRAYCKRVFQPTRGEMVPLAVRQAWKTMVTGRPGPVVLDVPFDVFREAAAEETPRPKEWSANISCRCGADPDGLEKALDLLLAAERPVILVGQGVKYGGAAADLLALAERLQIPVASSASGIGAIDASHPLALGLVARNGPYHANHATRQADVLLALGVRFDDRTSSSWLPGYSFTIPPTRLIHVDIDPDEIARNYPVALGLMADVRTFLRQLLGALERRGNVGERAAARAKWLDAIAGYRREWEAFVAPGFVDDASPINPQRAAHEIDKALPADAILVSDIGIHHNWLIQFSKPRRPDSLIGSMGFGPMGFGVAGVLGAKLAAPDRPCVSVYPGGLAGVEQLRLCLDPRAAARLSRRPRARHRLQASRHRAALQSRFRRHGALRRHRRRAHRPRRRPRRCRAPGNRHGAALFDRRADQRRPQSRRRRRVGTARPRPEPARHRSPLHSELSHDALVGTRQ
jgi:acetolactate synthase-1/2/3 large subunit